MWTQGMGRWALAFGALSLSCSEEPRQLSENTGRSTSALAASLSEELYVEGPPEPLETDWFGTLLEVKCTTATCLAVYVATTPYRKALLATRVARDGTLVDAPHLLLEEPTSRGIIPFVFVRGDDFLVVWTTGNFNQGDTRAEAATVRASDGQVTRFTPAFQPPAASNGFTLVSAGTNFVAIHESGLQPLRGSDLSTMGPALPRGGVIPGAGQYLVFGADFTFRRLGDADGAFLDPAPVRYNHYGHVGGWHGTYADGVYQLVTATNGSLYGRRIRASDGAVLDADDLFNQVSNAKLVCSGCTLSDRLKVHAWGASSLVTWPDSSYPTGIAGIRLSPQTGLRTDGPLDQPDFHLAEIGDQEPGLYRFPEGGGGLLTSWIKGLRVVAETAGPFALTVGPPRPPWPTSEARVNPAVASNGQDFLVAWARGGGVHATRVDGVTGAYLDDPALSVGDPASSPEGIPWSHAVASDGEDYLVLWIAVDQSVHRRFVRSNGVVESALTPPLAPVVASFSNRRQDPRLTWNGRHYLASWTETDRSHVGLRLTAAGMPVDSTPLRLGNNALGSTVADTAPPADQRTFYVGTDGGIQLLRSESGVLVLPQLQAPRGGTTYTLGTDGASAFMLWPGDDTLLQVQRIDALTGRLLGTPARLEGVPGYYPAGTLHDGRSQLVLSVNDTQTTAYVSRFDSDFRPLDTQAAGGLALFEEIDNNYWPRIATNGSGRSLAVIARGEPLRGNLAIVARFIDNDGLPAPAPPDGGVDGGARPEAGAADAKIPDGNTVQPDGRVPADSGSPGDARAGTGGAPGAGGEPSAGGSGGTPIVGSGGAIAGGAGSTDAGATSPTPGGDDGCGCVVARSSAPSPLHAGVAAGLLATLLVRRRRSGLSP